MTGFPGLPTAGGEPRQVAAVVNRLNLGKLNCTGAATLAANQPATLVSDPRAGGDSFIAFMPVTANAAAEVAGGAMYVSGRTRGAFTLAHANNALADRSFVYLIIG